VNLIPRHASTQDTQSGVSVNQNLENFKWIALHPGAYKQSFPYLIMVDKNDRLSVRKFQLVSGYSKPLNLEE